MAHTNGTLKQVEEMIYKVGDVGKGKADSRFGQGNFGKISGLVTDVNGLVNGLDKGVKDVPALMAKVQSDISEVELLRRCKIIG